MKSNPWLLGGLAWLAAAAVWAQTPKNSAATRHETATPAKDVVLDPPASAVVTQESLNVRGQASFAGEVIAHLHKAQTVTVLEEMTLKKPKAHEPANWSRIALPADATVWVFGEYLDTNAMTVSARRVNVRGGPGENYSVVARLEKGTAVKEVRRARGWIQIEPPTNAFGFVASEYLEKQAAAVPPAAPVTAPEPVATTPPATAPPTPATNNEIAAAVTNAPPPTPPTNAIVAPEPVATPPAVAAAGKPAMPETKEAVPEPAAISEADVADTKPRIVTREGYLRRTMNVQAPADFELHDIDTGRLTEYVRGNNKDFKVYAGARVSLTGQEVVDQRWPKTPVLRVKTVFLMP